MIGVINFCFEVNVDTLLLRRTMLIVACLFVIYNWNILYDLAADRNIYLLHRSADTS